MSQTKACLTKQEVTIITQRLYDSKDIKVINFNLKPFSNETLGYLGTHELLTVEVCEKNKNEIKILTFFVKSCAQTGNSFEKMIFAEEVKFFKDLIPRMLKISDIEAWTAKCYLAKDDLLVLEDLRNQGFMLSNNINENQLKSTMISVARFHASSIILEAQLKKPLNEIYPNNFKPKSYVNDGSLNWLWILTGIEVVEAIANKIGLNAKHIMTAYMLIVKKLKVEKEQKDVLCHNDLWFNNLMFSEDGNKCRLIDFQMVVYRFYIFDLIQMLHLLTSKVIREKLEIELIKLYHSTLSNILMNHEFNKDIISLEEVIRDYDENRVYGLVSAAQYFPITLLNKEEVKNYTSDMKKFEEYTYKNRKDFVLDVMEKDEIYKKRLEETVRELIDYMEQS